MAFQYLTCEACLNIKKFPNYVNSFKFTGQTHKPEAVTLVLGLTKVVKTIPFNQLSGDWFCLSIFSNIFVKWTFRKLDKWFLYLLKSALTINVGFNHRLKGL